MSASRERYYERLLSVPFIIGGFITLATAFLMTTPHTWAIGVAVLTALWSMGDAIRNLLEASSTKRFRPLFRMQFWIVIAFFALAYAKV